MKMLELLFLGGVAVEIPFKQSNTWCNFVRNFMVSVVALPSSFYCVLLGCYDGLYELILEPMYLCPICWTLVLKG